MAKKQTNLTVFPIGTDILLRSLDYRNSGKGINRVCTIRQITEKAMLFKVNREIEEDITIDILFWLPKSTLYMVEG